MVADLGLVDLDLGSSPAGGPLLYLRTAQVGWWNIPNLSQPNPGPRPLAPPCSMRHMYLCFGVNRRTEEIGNNAMVTLYKAEFQLSLIISDQCWAVLLLLK